MRFLLWLGLVGFATVGAAEGDTPVRPAGALPRTGDPLPLSLIHISEPTRQVR
jgi:hypothetical protein